MRYPQVEIEPPARDRVRRISREMGVNRSRIVSAAVFAFDGLPAEKKLAALIPSGIGATNHDRADTIRSAQPTTPALQTPVESRP